MEDVFKHLNYPTQRPRLSTAYIDQMVAYLHLQHPTRTHDELEKFVKTVVARSIKVPDIEILRHPSPGNTIRETVPLLTHIQSNIDQNIISPSGTVYMPPTRKESFLKVILGSKVKERKVYKKLYLSALEADDVIQANNNNYIQASTKIFANSAPGAMGSPYNILYDLPGYNATTSIARHCVKYGYSFTERFIGANLFLTSLEDVIGYCLQLQSVRPASMMAVVGRHGLVIPSVFQVYDYFLTCLRYYMLTPPVDKLFDFISKLSIEARTFVFYAGCWKNLTHVNDQFFRDILGDLFCDDVIIDPHDRPEDVYKFETDLLSMITSLYYDVLGRNEKGERYNLADAIKGCPDGVRHIMAIARHMNTVLGGIGDLLRVFLRLETDFPRIGDHQHMIRRAVLVSDTDSVIFTTEIMVEWYCKGKVAFNKESYQINALTVYLISRSLEHIFARQSCWFGMVGEDIKRISMKNEFLYPVMLRTPISKHYAGIAQMQEGKLLAKPKNDIKGVNFRSSTLPALTNKAAEVFLISTMNTLMKDGSLKACDILSQVANYEAYVFASIMAGDKTYLETATVQRASDYANPAITAYFYYELWERVFVPKFDTIALPNKCFKLPLLREGKILRDEKVLEEFDKFDKDVGRKLRETLIMFDKRALSYLLIPPTMTVIPPIFRPLIDVRSIVYRNCGPFYLALKSMGFGYTFSKEMLLVNDFFNPSGVSIPHLL